MGDLDSYRPSDFLMFSGRVYWRLIERYNEALWPAQLLGLLVGLLILFALCRPLRSSDTLIRWGLALAWAGVAASFLREGYAPINWTVNYLMPLFAVQSALLIGVAGRPGCLSRPSGWPGRIGLGLILMALLLPPILTMMAGRGLATTDWFPFFPDTLTVATLGIVAGGAPGLRTNLLLVVPVTWCLFNGTTLLILDAPLSGGFLLVAAILAIIARLIPMRGAH